MQEFKMYKEEGRDSGMLAHFVTFWKQVDYTSDISKVL